MTASAPAAPKGGVILVDLNNIGFAAQLGAKTRLMSGDMETTGIYGTLRSLKVVREMFNGQMICLHDGRSWRYEAFEGYKANRKTDPKVVEAAERWKASKPWVAKMLRLLPIGQIVARNMEADDLAARMRRLYARQGREVLLVSGDKDWLQLIQPGVMVYDHKRERRVTHLNFEEMVGLPTPRSLVEAKSMMGDQSDCIPGMGGVGEGTAFKVLNEFGSIDGFVNEMLADPDRRKQQDRFSLRLLDPTKREVFDRNLRLIDLDHPDVPAPIGTSVVKGEFRREDFTDLCGELAFHSILRDLDKWIAPFTEGTT